ncbi:hypothetical protein C8N36_112105 [Pelagimonas varians]|nr:hypothetical protein C8N36_112105 [Pelagimonas varians]
MAVVWTRRYLVHAKNARIDPGVSSGGKLLYSAAVEDGLLGWVVQLA